MVAESNSDMLRYAVFSNNEWGVEMDGVNAADDSDADYAGVIGIPFTYITIGGVEKYRVFTRKHKWSKFFTEFNKSNPAGDGSPILAIEIYDKDVVIGIHVKGGSWLSGKNGTFEGDTNTPTYAGIMTPIDAIWIDR